MRKLNRSSLKQKIIRMVIAETMGNPEKFNSLLAFLNFFKDNENKIEENIREKVLFLSVFFHSFSSFIDSSIIELSQSDNLETSKVASLAKEILEDWETLPFNLTISRNDLENFIRRLYNCQEFAAKISDVANFDFISIGALVKLFCVQSLQENGLFIIFYSDNGAGGDLFVLSDGSNILLQDLSVSSFLSPATNEEKEILKKFLECIR